MPRLETATGMFNIALDGPEGGPALMLSNSLSSNLSMWEPQIAALSQRFRVVRYDSRGAGRSVVSPGPYSIAELGRDALAIMDALGLETVDWCGLSKGGMVGQWLLVNAPHRIRRAVLANTAALMPPPALWNGRIRNVRANGMAAIVEATIERWFTTGFVASEPATIARVKAMIAATPAEGYVGCCAAIRDMDQRDAITTIGRPVLLISGRHDPATTPVMMTVLEHRIPGARRVDLDASHLSNVEQPAAFTAALMEFLS